MAIKPAKTTGAWPALHGAQDGGRLQCRKCMGSPESIEEEREAGMDGRNEDASERGRGACALLHAPCIERESIMAAGRR